MPRRAASGNKTGRLQPAVDRSLLPRAMEPLAIFRVESRSPMPGSSQNRPNRRNHSTVFPACVEKRTQDSTMSNGIALDLPIEAMSSFFDIGDDKERPIFGDRAFHALLERAEGQPPRNAFSMPAPLAIATRSAPPAVADGTPAGCYIGAVIDDDHDEITRADSVRWSSSTLRPASIEPSPSITKTRSVGKHRGQSKEHGSRIAKLHVVERRRTMIDGVENTSAEARPGDGRGPRRDNARRFPRLPDASWGLRDMQRMARETARQPDAGRPRTESCASRISSGACLAAHGDHVWNVQRAEQRLGDATGRGNVVMALRPARCCGWPGSAAVYAAQCLGPGSRPRVRARSLPSRAPASARRGRRPIAMATPSSSREQLTQIMSGSALELFGQRIVQGVRQIGREGDVGVPESLMDRLDRAHVVHVAGAPTAALLLLLRHRSSCEPNVRVARSPSCNVAALTLTASTTIRRGSCSSQEIRSHICNP